MHKYVNTLLVALVSLFLLTGCPTAAVLDDTIGVAPGEMATLCIKGVFDRSMTDSYATYTRVEFPDSMPPENITAEAIAAACPDNTLGR